MVEFQNMQTGPSPVQSASVSPDLNSSYKEKKSMVPKKGIVIVLAIIIVLCIGVLAILIAPVQKTYSSALKTQAEAKKAWDAVKKQNVELASEELVKTKQALDETKRDLNSFSYAKFIPIVNIYYSDAGHMLQAGAHGLNAASLLVNSVKPYADVLGLNKGKGSFVMGSAEDRIRVAVSTLGKITPRIDDISNELVLARKEIDMVSPSHYPSIFMLGKVNSSLTQIRTISDQGVMLVSQARPLIKILPALLGEEKEKKYLILFQNDKELRPTGGFITAYAVFRIDKGVIHVDKADDIYTLDNNLRVKVKAPDAILKYLPNVTTFNIRDSNLSPDFVESMKTFNSMYQNTSDKTTVDGIIALDTHVLASTIKILDDEVWAGGMLFTSKNDKRCDCPQVIYTLESLTDQPKSLDLRVSSLAAEQAHRKDILGILLYSIMQKALKSSPKLYWGPLMQQMITETNQKHVLLYLYDQDAQKGVEALGVAGRIRDFDGDYLHINQANMGGAKANLFVDESVKEAVDVAGDGTITKTITISYKNPHAPSDCNLERGGLCLNATLRDWVRLYVPKGSVLVNSQGSEVKVTTYQELGKTVFDGFLTVRPLGTATYTITYKLPFKINKNSSFPLLIQKQPGRDNDEYTLVVNGRTVAKSLLLTDIETKIQP